jgi:hypothetical protein
VSEAIEGVADRIVGTLLSAGFDCTDAMENAANEAEWFFDTEIDGVEVTVVVSPYSGGTNWDTP